MTCGSVTQQCSCPSTFLALLDDLHCDESSRGPSVRRLSTSSRQALMPRLHHHLPSCSKVSRQNAEAYLFELPACKRFLTLILVVRPKQSAESPKPEIPPCQGWCPTAFEELVYLLFKQNLPGLMLALCPYFTLHWTDCMEIFCRTRMQMHTHILGGSVMHGAPRTGASAAAAGWPRATTSWTAAPTSSTCSGTTTPPQACSQLSGAPL